jgi:hypothetical protein
MWTAILRAFAPSNPKQISDLIALREYRFSAADLSGCKRRLSELICGDGLPAERFYRFEASPGGSKVTISFYLFDGRRLCPLRIWNRTELYGQVSAGPEWMVDFNGLPPWSAITAVEPHWRLLGPLSGRDSTVGRSARDWSKRSCWVIDPPDVELAPEPSNLPAIQHGPFLPDHGTPGQ